MSLLRWMGMGSASRVADGGLPDGDERFFGLENFGNTCYCNAVLQSLYFCRPFREHVIGYDMRGSGDGGAGDKSTASSPLSSSNAASSQSAHPPKMAATGVADTIYGIEALEKTLFGSLRLLYDTVRTQKRKTGSVSPSQFITKLRKENELFRSTMHQDAHEFLNYILNTVAEDVEKFEGATANATQGAESSTKTTSSNLSSASASSTWVHDLFQGVLTSETRCLTCETITNRDETFIDLSIDIEQHTSVTACLKQFSAREMLRHCNKFHCDKCHGLQEAEKRMKIKRLPRVLALHLKRFKYQERLQRYVKLSYRVVYPQELRVFETCDDTPESDRLYSLFAIVVHIGSGPHHGHYVAIVKSNGQWVLFDDDSVELITEADLANYYGDQPSIGSSYVLFYESVSERDGTGGDYGRDSTPGRVSADGGVPMGLLSRTPTTGSQP